MSHAPAEAEVWKQTLLAGQVDLAVGELAGRVLGRMHEATARDTALVAPFADHTVFVQLRADPFYRRVQERVPEVSAAVTPMLNDLLSVKEALCHGDFSPKNILTHRQGFTLVDYETAHFGDPTMDLGFFLSHLVLKAVKNPALRQRYFDLSWAFWSGYAEAVRFRPLEELQARGVAHFAVCTIARIDGTSPVDYLADEVKRAAARRIGRQILLGRVTRWDEALAIADACISQLVTDGQA
jgi:5-methylthioribose kinase